MFMEMNRRCETHKDQIVATKDKRSNVKESEES